MSDPCPCSKDCPFRRTGTDANCHVVCLRYIKWRAARDEENKKRRALKLAEQDAFNLKRDQVTRWYKRHGK